MVWRDPRLKDEEFFFLSFLSFKQTKNKMWVPLNTKFYTCRERQISIKWLILCPQWFIISLLVVYLKSCWVNPIQMFIRECQHQDFLRVSLLWLDRCPREAFGSCILHVCLALEITDTWADAQKKKASKKIIFFSYFVSFFF